jgi:hypothetical protein
MLFINYDTVFISGIQSNNEKDSFSTGMTPGSQLLRQGNLTF